MAVPATASKSVRALHNPPARQSPSAGAGAVQIRVIAIALATMVLVLALASANTYWLCLPAVLLAAGLAATIRGAAVAAATVSAAAEVGLAAAGAGSRPSIVLAVVVPAGCVAVLIAVRRRLEREREHLRGVALSDPLTGVANRRLLLARADYEIQRHTRDQRSFALVMLDLDGFKRLNDTYGHAAGDDVLCEVADALREALRAQDTIARLGGDEFCVLAPETDRAGVRALGIRIGDAVARATAGVDRLGGSIGIAIFPDDGTGTAALMEAADQRLLGAKRNLYERRREPRRAA